MHTDIAEEGAYWHDMAEEGEYKWNTRVNYSIWIQRKLIKLKYRLIVLLTKGSI